ncbi:HAD-like domain-containing protein [Zychaea mexicana]|uniref:HAD-like domain-containing protein n=1 Tax=Zychaea mexicana TaxID=64656 RepID=UPI0022FDE508|nr:HAD-like domain-containing protein [Zychaea mexicana]KAI9489164.1 HAD-like domain-containing protein [Zychaea mexicana]
MLPLSSSYRPLALSTNAEPTMTCRIRLVTFDAYLTLFKPTGSVSLQYAEEAVKHGVQVTKAAISQNFGVEFNNQLQRYPLYGHQVGKTTRTWWEELIYATYIGAGVSKQVLDPVYDKVFDALFIRFATAEGYTVFPEVRETLIQLRQKGYKMGVLSNSDETVVSVLEGLGLAQYFDFILPSCMVGYDKPDKRMYEKALQEAGVRPEEALHVGDDLET